MYFLKGLVSHIFESKHVISCLGLIEYLFTAHNSQSAVKKVLNKEASNPRYSADRDQEDHCSMPVQANETLF
jgi:hypothetical protein